MRACEFWDSAEMGRRYSGNEYMNAHLGHDGGICAASIIASTG